MTEKNEAKGVWKEVPVPEEEAYPAYPERSYEEARIKEDYKK